MGPVGSSETKEKIDVQAPTNQLPLFAIETLMIEQGRTYRSNLAVWCIYQKAKYSVCGAKCVPHFLYHYDFLTWYKVSVFVP